MALDGGVPSKKRLVPLRSMPGPRRPPGPASYPGKRGCGVGSAGGVVACAQGLCRGRPTRAAGGAPDPQDDASDDEECGCGGGEAARAWARSTAGHVPPAVRHVLFLHVKHVHVGGAA